MTDENGKDKDALQDLSGRISEVKNRRKPVERSQATGNLMTLAYRMTIEIIAAIGVSGFIGWWLDRIFDTKPVFMLILLFLGMFAGLLGSVRTARQMSENANQEANDPDKGLND